MDVLDRRAAKRDETEGERYADGEMKIEEHGWEQCVVEMGAERLCM